MAHAQQRPGPKHNTARRLANGQRQWSSSANEIHCAKQQTVPQVKRPLRQLRFDGSLLAARLAENPGEFKDKRRLPAVSL